MKYLDLRLAKELRKGIKISEGIRGIYDYLYNIYTFNEN